MTKTHLAMAALAILVILCGHARGESLMDALDAMGSAANRLNTDFLDRIDGQPAQTGNGFQADIARYKRLEAARVREMSAVTGVSQNVIRQMRSSGQTWEQIAATYNVDLDSLPNPETAGN